MLIKRSYLNSLIDAINRNKIIALVGARQTGKTTLLHQLMCHLREQLREDFERYLLLQSFDSLEFRNELQRDTGLLEKLITEKTGLPLNQLNHTFYLLLDEAQKLPAIFEIVKKIHDAYSPQIKIVMTGSSSLEMRDQGAETLAGRIEYHFIFPLTFQEAGVLKEESLKVFSAGASQEWAVINPQTQKLTFYLIDSLLEGRLGRDQIEDAQTKRVWFESVIREDEQNFFVSGLYPEVVSKKSREDQFRLLDNYVATYVERDVRNLAHVTDWQGYYHLLEVLASRVGQLLDYSKVGAKAGLDVRTVKKYLSLLDQTFITFSFSSYSFNVERRVTKAPKIFFCDNGILSRLLKVTDLRSYEALDWMGRIFENAILAELIKYLKNRPLPVGVYFWRTYTGVEVDCVLEAEGRLIPIEIKSSSSIEERDWTNLRSFKREFGKRTPCGYLLYRGRTPIYKPAENLVAIPYHMIFC